MTNGNVEYNEVRCKTILLGSEETGFIQLSVTEDPDDSPTMSPTLSIFDPNNDKPAGVGIQFIDGHPTLTLQVRNEKNDSLKSIILLMFDEKGLPFLQINNHDETGAIIKNITLGLMDDEFPRLHFSSNEKNSESFMRMGLGKHGEPHILMINEDLKGGNIFVIADKDEAAMMLTSRDRLANQDSKTGDTWGILMVQGPEQSMINVEGKDEISASRQRNSTDSET